MCEAFHMIGKWFASNAVRLSHGLEGTRRILIRKHNRNHLQIQTHSEIYGTAICNEACPTQLFVSKLPLIFSDDTSDSDEDRVQQERDNMTPIRHLKQVVPNLNHIF
jgi:hypothetical protein